MTLMGIFATWTLLVVEYNSGGHAIVDQRLLQTMQLFVALTWAAWGCGVYAIATKKGVVTESLFSGPKSDGAPSSDTGFLARIAKRFSCFSGRKAR